MYVGEEVVAQRFMQDVKDISTEMISSFNLTHAEDISSLSDPVSRWLDFRLRFIDPIPRKIVYSKKFPISLNPEAEKALRDIERKVTRGEDINNYQSTGLLSGDTSGVKRQRRTDLLWAEWNIHHLHLNSDPNPNGGYFSKRADCLLFLIIDRETAAFIDIRDHKESLVFCRDELIKSVSESWPTFLNRFELIGCIPAQTQPTSSKIKQLRESGITSPIAVGGKPYMGPGLGVTTASTSTRVSMITINILGYIKQLAHLVCMPNNCFQLGQSSPEKFSISLTQRGLAVFHDGLSMAWPIPALSENMQNRWLGILRDYFTPDWYFLRLKQLIQEEENLWAFLKLPE